jgi:RNA polymerase sigma-70 factor (ECF subfamily)
MPDLLSLFPRISVAPSPERLAAGHEAVKNVEDALARLSATDREALILVGVEDMSPQTAAAVCGVSGEVFRQRLSRARTRLTALMGQEGM